MGVFLQVGCVSLQVRQQKGNFTPALGLYEEPLVIPAEREKNESIKLHKVRADS